MIGTSRSVWGFDPRSVPGCQLWLDAADATTVTGTTSVTAWRDKSANGYVANSFVNSVPNPSWVSNVRNGNGVIQYSAGNGSSIANFVLAQTMSIFKVYYPINQSIGSPFIEQGPNAGSESGFFFHSQNDNNFYIRAGSIGLANFGTTTVSNTWQMIEGINPDPANGNTVAFYVNGITRASGGTQSDTTTVTKTLYINGRAGTSSVSYNTYLAELIIYNIAVTNTQRQQIEGYLAHKWGLTGYYDSSIPLSIPGCQLWLDGADTTSMTLSGSSVTQWNDKSGNGLNVSAASSQPTYVTNGLNGLGTLAFNGSQGLSAGSVTGEKLLGNTGSSAMFCVFSVSNSSQNSCPITWDDSGYTYRYLLALESSQGLNFDLGDISQGGQNRINIPTSSVTFVNNTYYLVSFWKNGSNVVLNVNGGIFTSSSSTFLGNWSTTASRLLNIGTYINTSTYNLKGNIAEILIYNTHIPSNFKQVEGYLSKKWGIGSNPSIPSTHPFSSIRPHLRTFQPTDVPGCQLWLDAADQSSMTLSGSSVTQWNDKSGNGGNATRLTGDSYATLTTVSGNRILSFPGANALYRSPMVLTGAAYTIFTISSLLSTGGNGSGYQRMINTDLRIFIGAVNGILGTFSGNGAWNDINPNTPNYTLLGAGLQLVTMVVSGSSLIPYINGTAMDTKTGTTTATTVLDIGGQQTNAQHWNGYIGDIIVFNTALTTSERQQVEGYLAHKWGLTLSLPVISPLSIPGCQLWLDGADSSTIAFSSGSNISSWTNKGTVSTTATPTRGPSANQITYVTVDGYPGVYINNNGSAGYNSSTYSQLTIQSNFQNTEDYSVFAVVNLSNVTGASMQTIYGNERGTSGETRSPNFGAGQSFEFNAAGGSRVIDLSFIGSGRLQTALISSSSALTAYTNATAYGSATNGLTRFSTDAGPLPRIGGAFGSINDPRFATGYFHEILFYNSALTTTQRQQIEGYLARKWGISISATLPSPHPFKSFPPATLPFSPRNISGCQLWLDAADQSSMTLSGSNVTQWNDKSGNGRNATGQVSAVIGLDSTGYYLDFTGSTYYTLVSGAFIANQYYTIFIVERLQTNTGYRHMIGSLTLGPNNGALHIRYEDSTTLRFAYFNNDLDARNIPALTSAATQPTRILTFSQLPSSRTIYINSVSFVSDANNTLLSGWAQPLIGQSFGNDYYIGRMREIIFYTGQLTTSERQQVEGYLAQKWGLTGSLPSTHPYKKLPA